MRKKVIRQVVIPKGGTTVKVDQKTSIVIDIPAGLEGQVRQDFIESKINAFKERLALKRETFNPFLK